ncbi:MAG: hypothetical protein GX561_10815 [Lentisphaerae bacterium]|jgi:hypothetical protein|nr:hypothetical protein [Lentisphaerota bacterium]
MEKLLRQQAFVLSTAYCALALFCLILFQALPEGPDFALIPGDSFEFQPSIQGSWEVTHVLPPPSSSHGELLEAVDRSYACRGSVSRHGGGFSRQILSDCHVGLPSSLLGVFSRDHVIIVESLGGNAPYKRQIPCRAGPRC